MKYPKSFQVIIAFPHSKIFKSTRTTKMLQPPISHRSSKYTVAGWRCGSDRAPA
jgi:hypothetical protein